MNSSTSCAGGPGQGAGRYRKGLAATTTAVTMEDTEELTAACHATIEDTEELAAARRATVGDTLTGQEEEDEEAAEEKRNGKAEAALVLSSRM